MIGKIGRCATQDFSFRQNIPQYLTYSDNRISFHNKSFFYHASDHNKDHANFSNFHVPVSVLASGRQEYLVLHRFKTTNKKNTETEHHTLVPDKGTEKQP